MKKNISLIIAVVLFLSVFGNVAFASDDETKLRVISLDINSLAKLSGEAYKLKQEYSANEGYVVKFAAYDENNWLLATSNDSDYRTYFPKEFAKVSAFVWRTYSTNGNNIRTVSLQVGTNESEKRLVWYNDVSAQEGRVQIALKDDYDNDGGFTVDNSKIFDAKVESPIGNTEAISCKAILNNLELGKTYVYRLGGKDSYDEKVYSFKTYDPDNSDKQVFLMVSDLHNNAYTINSVSESTHVTRYQEYFNKHILPRHPEVQFIASTGDNVSQGNMPTQFKEYMNSDEEIYRQKAELEMEVLFAPDVFKSVPWISTLGNHEASNNGKINGSVTRWHYNQPNDDGITGTYYSSALGEPNTNGNFWFRNGDVLVVGINSVQHTTTTFQYSQSEQNATYIKAAIEANKDAKWRILINHVPAYSYSGGFDEAPAIRRNFAAMDIDQYDFDVVFAGHHHNYSRTKQILTDGDAYENFTYDGKTVAFISPKVVSEDKVVRSTDANNYSYDIATDPEGTVHITLPSLGMGAELKPFHPDYAHFVEVNGTKSGTLTINNDKYASLTLTPDNVESDWIYLSGNSHYVVVTVEKAEDGSQQMKFELTNTLTGAIYDTYIIKKTK